MTSGALPSRQPFLIDGKIAKWLMCGALLSVKLMMGKEVVR